MEKFIRKCYCEKSGIEFRFQDNFDATSIDILYCPRCIEHASLNTLLIRLNRVFDIEPGIWGIKFSSAALKEQDKNFRESSDYFVDLFASGKITFDFIRSLKDYEILGMAGGMKLYEDEAKKDIEKDLRKKHKLRPIKKL